MRFTELTDCPYYLISRVALQVTSVLKKGFTAAGVREVRPAYLGVLMSLWQADGIKVVALGRKAGLEPSTMTGLIDRMERDGLVVRRVVPEDRRAQQIWLTTLGRDLKAPVEAVIEEVMANVFADIAQSELEQTKKLLRQVLGNLQEGAGK
ncbi:MAG: MarR family transcriptional regulator [Desulfobacterales bacterium]|nr:MarR family transcriptional regulator [Desulfobacterales bacterium]